MRWQRLVLRCWEDLVSAKVHVPVQGPGRPRLSRFPLMLGGLLANSRRQGHAAVYPYVGFKAR
jgi:hypothetical protein